MDDPFDSIVLAHRARYPRMQPQDYGKLAYQREFGPAHLAASPVRLLAELLAEWQSIPAGRPPQPPEKIGGGLCRFHLTGEYAPAEAAPLLAKLVARTGSAHAGTGEGLDRRLEALCSLAVPGLDPWLQAYRARGYPRLSHSAEFRAAYRPHYRLLGWEYACYFPILLAIGNLIGGKNPVLVAIDGRCGSGKTGLAQCIAQVFPCSLFHMDDFYLPPALRIPGWAEIPGGNMDFGRFREEVLRPARAGEAVTYRPFDCQAGRPGAPVTVAPHLLTLVEGSYAHHPALRMGADLTVFLTCAPREQRRRLLAREGDYFSVFADQWIPGEERYFQRWDVERGSDLVLDTSNFF